MRAPPRHGTPSKYVSGCRCDACRKAASEYRKAHRKSKRQDPTISSPDGVIWDRVHAVFEDEDRRRMEMLNRYIAQEDEIEREKARRAA